MISWMNSTGHRANILKAGFEKIGVGYCNVNDSDYWVQMFGGGLTAPDTLSTSKILTASITTRNGTLPTEGTATFDTVIAAGNTNIRRGGTYIIEKNFSGTIRINTTDAVTIDGTNSGNLANVQIISYADNAALMIKNLNVTNTSGSVITFGSGNGNKLTLAGKQGSGIGSNSYDTESNANITINGGNDSLIGGDGADTLSGGDGKNIIYGFENDDLLKITGKFSASYSKSKAEVYFKVGTTKNAITLHDFTATSFHVNGATYQISGSKFVKK